MTMNKFYNPDVEKIFNSYPKHIRTKMMFLRQLVLDTAKEIEGLAAIEETLKWGEPSYLTKGGSTLRIDWKESKPDHYALYFNCKSKLVDTFKELYRDTLKFEGNRAIVFNVEDIIPINELKHCILLTFTYHKIKHLPLLGV